MAYIVICGKRRSYIPETEIEITRDDVVRDIVADQYHEPMRVLQFSLAHGMIHDVSEDIARHVLNRARDAGYIAEGSLCRSAVEFTERHLPGWYYSMVEAA